jgi:tetratricopeptide (TPR) repeat protein
MDALYENAVALAADRRYEEAKAAVESLLRDDPADAAALVLLGKIEYYLGHDRSSRKAFELALTHEPDNFAAYLGSRYYRERRLKRIGLGLLLAAVIISCAGAVFFYSRQAASDAAALETVTALLSEKNSRLEAKLATVTAAEAREAEESARFLALLNELVRKQRERDAGLEERLKALEALLDARLGERE